MNSTPASMSGFKDHFSSHAEAYAAYRPAYPESLVADLVALAPGRTLAWDCATGNGQAARLLATQVERVVATDASSDQIAHAIQDERVQYRVAREDESGLADASADIVTVAAALHWLDLKRFYAEVHRVLKPGGVLAAWTYALVEVTPTIDGIVRWFANDRVGTYWPPERAHVDRGYRDLPFLYQEVDLGSRSITASLTREQFLGYVGTWSSSVRANMHEGADVIQELRDQLKPLWNDVTEMTIHWPLHVRAGRKPA